MVSTGEDKVIILWKINSHKDVVPVQKITDIHERSIYSCSVSFDNEFVATVC
jgi:hypothetical protein